MSQVPAIEQAWLVEATYASDAAETRVPFRAAHLARLLELKERGVVVDAGAFTDVSASIVLVRAESEEAALAVCRDDVYMRSGVWVEIRLARSGGSWDAAGGPDFWGPMCDAPHARSIPGSPQRRSADGSLVRAVPHDRANDDAIVAPAEDCAPHASNGPEPGAMQVDPCISRSLRSITSMSCTTACVADHPVGLRRQPRRRSIVPASSSAGPRIQ